MKKDGKPSKMTIEKGLMYFELCMNYAKRSLFGTWTSIKVSLSYNTSTAKNSHLSRRLRLRTSSRGSKKVLQNILNQPEILMNLMILSMSG